MTSPTTVALQKFTSTMQVCVLEQGKDEFGDSLTLSTRVDLSYFSFGRTIVVYTNNSLF